MDANALKTIAQFFRHTTPPRSLHSVADVPRLVHYFVSRLSGRMQKRIKSIPKLAMDALTNAAWPGNVRELGNFVQGAVILTQGDELNVPLTELKTHPSDLPLRYRHSTKRNGGRS
jgi:DNA-binding NtrC family response regulator